jgi:dTDP-4-dehydrorhamnose reductase
MLRIGTAGVILRTSWLYSQFGHNFVQSIWRKCQQGQPLQVIDDQIGSPTYALELATLCLKLVTTDDFAKRFATPQLLHCAGQGQTSWYQFAQEIIKHSKQQVVITPLTSQQWQGAAIRPAYSALNSQQLLQQLGLSLPPWQQSLASCLNKMGQSE